MIEVALHTEPTTNQLKRLFMALFVLLIGATALVAMPVAADDLSTNETAIVEFENTPLTVEPPETAEFRVSATDSKPLTFDIESVGDERFALEATVVDHDGNVTIELDTEHVTAADPASYLTASGGDLQNITVQANEIEALDRELLPGGMYDIRIATEQGRHHSTLVVTPAVRFSEAPTLEYAALEDSPEQRFTGRTDLDPGTELRIRATSRGDGAFLLTNETVVASDGTFEVDLDMQNVPPGSRFMVTAYHDNISKGMTMGSIRGDGPENDATSDGIALVYDGDQLELEAAPAQRITGEAHLNHGEPVMVRLTSTGETAFLYSAETEVDDHGTFEVTFDLEDIPPGTAFSVEARSPQASPEVSASAPGIIVESKDDGAHDEGMQNTYIDDSDPDEGGVTGEPLGGLGATITGAILAIVGIGFLLGFGRSLSLQA